MGPRLLRFLSFLNFNKPEKGLYSVINIFSLFVITDIITIIIYSLLYYYNDNEYNEKGEFDSMFNGIQKREYIEYLYYAIIINTTLGLGDINPKQIHKNSVISRYLTASHTIIALWIDYMIITMVDVKFA